jgi:hypothetical protein
MHSTEREVSKVMQEVMITKEDLCSSATKYSFAFQDMVLAVHSIGSDQQHPP